jgi:hypothetical protein
MWVFLNFWIFLTYKEVYILNSNSISELSYCFSNVKFIKKIIFYFLEISYYCFTLPPLPAPKIWLNLLNQVWQEAASARWYTGGHTGQLLGSL